MRKYGCVFRGGCVHNFTCSILLYVCGTSKIALMRDHKIVSLRIELFLKKKSFKKIVTQLHI